MLRKWAGLDFYGIIDWSWRFAPERESTRLDLWLDDFALLSLTAVVVTFGFCGMARRRD